MATRLRDFISRRRLIYAGVAVLCFLLSVSLLAALIEPDRPPNDLDDLSAKIAYFDAHRDAVDIIIVGSSRVYRGINPALVEASIVDHGCRPRTVFNFGLSGMSAPLMAKLMDYIAATATRDHMVFFEPELPLGPEFDFTVTERARFSNQWSTIVPGTLQLAASYDGSTRSSINTGILYMKYAASFARTGLGVGRLRDLILSKMNEPATPSDPGVPWNQAGFYSLDQELRASSGDQKSTLARRRAEVTSSSGRAGLATRFQEMDAALRKPVAASQFQQRYVDYLLDRARLRGITPAFIFMPMNDAQGAIRQAAMAAYIEKTHPEITVIDANPSHMPDLYQPAFWFDYGHLTAAGAAQLSQYVGVEICQKMKAE